MDLDLIDKVAVVTGANRGIGLAVTRALLAEGAYVVSGSRTTDNLDGLERVTAVPVDLVAADGPALLMQRAVEAHGRLDVLVNNVGAVRIRTEGFLGTSDEEFLVTMLASGRVANVTGANYVIDGGLVKTT
jgi:NAD(P)-dependent dehydrogenase (short-subunit alcohol dehydrogenase family)